MNVYAKSALLGVTTGLRASAGPLSARWITKGEFPRKHAAALGAEMIADKMPFIGNRAAFPAILGRAGAAIFAAKSVSKRTNLGALALAAGATIGTSFAAQHLRKLLAERFNIPQQIIGIAEDALVVGLVYGASRVPNSP